MTDTRTTQVGRRALVGIQPDTRTTQIGRRALVEVHTDLRTTLIGRRTLADVQPCTTRTARIWTIRRVDGAVYRFTSKDTDLLYGGLTYRTCGSLNPSAQESSNESGSFATMTLTGVVSAAGITMADLDARRLDGASFTEWEVPWDGARDTPKFIQGGRWGRVEYSAEKGYQVEVLGDGALLQQAPLCQAITASCRWKDNIRDPRCPVSAHIADFTVTGTVEEGQGAHQFLDSTRTEDDDYFAFGTITFDTGANAGVTAEVRANLAGVFTLWPRLASPIAAGDDYTLVAGCDQLKPTCQTKFDAYEGFGGFFDVPGEDLLHSQPTAH